MLSQPQEQAEGGDKYQQSTEVGKNAGPADAWQRTVREAHIMDEEDAKRQESPPGKKQPGEALLCAFFECHPGLQDRKQEREITEIDHVDVGVHFGPAIFEKGTDVLKTRANRRTISGQSGMRGGRQARSNASRVLMQDENRKDVPEYHAKEDEANATKHEQAPRAQRS